MALKRYNAGVVKYLQYLILSLFCVFAAVGMLFTGVFFAQRLHVLNVAGIVDPKTSLFSITGKDLKQYAAPQVVEGLDTAPAANAIPTNVWCAILAAKQTDATLAEQMQKAFDTSKSADLVFRMLDAAHVTDQNVNFAASLAACTQTFAPTGTQTVYAWEQTPEWSVFKEAVTKDKGAILRAAAAAQIDPRLLVGVVMGEQMRFYTSNREAYKQYFEPLKILGNMTMFSYGVSGMKVETAQQVESYLHNANSPYYPGAQFEHLLDFSTTDAGIERFNRLTDKTDHYYSLLYAALDIKELEAQWQNAGYPIANRPEIIGTLYNLGFAHSTPKADPEVGGAGIYLGGKTYSFGRLTYEFYYSGELVDDFPYLTQAPQATDTTLQQQQ